MQVVTPSLPIHRLTQMSQGSSSSNAADLLSHFRDQQAKHEGPHIELGAVPSACFIYHHTGCDQCSAYVEHLLADMEHYPSKFSFSRDETLGCLQEAWPKLGQYITNIGDECNAAEKELIKVLETQIMSLQTNPQVGDQSIMVTSPTDAYSSDISPHSLASPETQTYSCRCPRKLIEDSSFRNHVLLYDEQPDYWSLHMWNILKDWHTNPMSVPNAIRDDSDGYFLEEDVDIVAWISKVSSDISHPTFMHQMKVVFGSRLNFETAFSGFPLNLLCPNHQASRWITDCSTPLRVGSQIIKGHQDKSQMPASMKLPTGPDFLALVLKHCSLTKEQIYNKIIPYMERHEEKRPCSAAGTECAAYMQLNQCPPAPNKGKRPVTGSLQSRLSVHAPTPAKTGESSQQWLDADLDSYNQVHELALPYNEGPPSGTPDVEMHVPVVTGTSSTLPNESTMNVDQELDDLYE
ncbi:hypothetical protein M422DRAFT_249170 [Sphaerobolus stellatus SS14]|nr:hypothetical protein M422DRAFT_249170 [Sphaerobolus stellatus SS14]